MRVSVTKSIKDKALFKKQLLQWSQDFREIVFLESNNYSEKHSSFSALLAVDAFTSIKTDFYNAFDDLKQYQQNTKDWILGYLSYDLKNDIENLESNNFDGLKFPDLFFFQPQKLFLIKENTVEIQYLKMVEDEILSDFETIENIILETNILNSESNSLQLKDVKQRISKNEYLDKVNKIKNHIQRGEIYEATFCMEFFVENKIINPLEKFQKLNEISQTPFAVFFKNHTHFLLSASPERYLKKQGNLLISQPIKGTSQRFLDAALDEKSKKELKENPKERAENIMITDLVRNDLSKIAQKKTVQVEELCEIYSFLQVHQMISTITACLDKTYTAIDALKSTFPMGSMTGAPKIAAMQIIEKLETTKRGLYSGAVGYFTPEGNFDFNVVIRSILYNEAEKYVSFSVGSAITFLSDAEKEYEECLLKAKAMLKVMDF